MANDTATKSVDQVREGELVTDDTNGVRAHNQTPTVITTPAEYQASLARWTKSQYHILAPFTNFSGLPQGFGIMPALVKIDPDPDHKEVYFDGLFCDSGEVAIAKVGLSKIAVGLGASIKTRRMDNCSVQYYYQVGATARIIGLSGTPQEFDAMLEYDLRDGSARIAKQKPGQIVGSRTHGLAGAESRVINRAIRQFGIKQSYSQRELERPFLCIRIAFQPDMSDPEVRKVVTQIAMQGTSMLYGGQSQEQPARELSTIGADEPSAALPPAQTNAAPAGAVAAAAAATAQPTKSETADPNQSPVEGAVRIADVKEKGGVNDKTKRAWKRFDVIDHNGEVCSTFDTKLAEAAMAAKSIKAWVELSIDTQGQYRNLIEISPAGQQPKLPNPEDL